MIRRTSLMAQRNLPVRLSFEQGSLTLAAQTQDVGEARESLPVDFQGERLEIGFNPDFLRDGVESVEGDTVRLKLISSLRPGLLQGEDDDVLVSDHADPAALLTRRRASCARWPCGARTSAATSGWRSSCRPAWSESSARTAPARRR